MGPNSPQLFGVLNHVVMCLTLSHEKFHVQYICSHLFIIQYCYLEILKRPFHIFFMKSRLMFHWYHMVIDVYTKVQIYNPRPKKVNLTLRKYYKLDELTCGQLDFLRSMDWRILESHDSRISLCIKVALSLYIHNFT